MLLILAIACASEEAVYAVQHLSVIPSASGLTGTQTWEFFGAGWAEDRSAEHHRCARAQTVTGTLTVPLTGCEGCVASYTIEVAELETDCEGELATSRSYSQVLLNFGVGDVPDDLADIDPYPGRAIGGYLSYDAGTTVEPYGWAYDEALDWSGELGAGGWVPDQTYTLWPAYAWDLRD